ncbi:MAG TPA: sulfate/molybdate ABC transporter ATP-binding protein [Nitrospiria bacterium]|nr:sulfate/molybdate ABC transporter ATP-binding protein [Nitrospiria bacterium]
MTIAVNAVTKRFGHFLALTDVNLTIPEGELVALLGPSGSGKTTLLRIIAGLETPDAGTIHFHGHDATTRAARDRQVGFVFQHYALFRHLTVYDNIAFGLRVIPRRLRPSRPAIDQKVRSLLQLVQLDWLASHYPSQLSGGQRQRVALARALAVEPRVMLLDEPFGALDAKVRLELRRWLRRLHDELHVTSVFVTHDQEEALEVADRVVVMNEGRIEQVGTAEEVYEQPANPFVYRFLGNVNLFHGRVHGGRVQIGSIHLDTPEHSGIQDTPAEGYVRPHDIEVDRTAPPAAIGVTVEEIRPVGPVVRLILIRQDGGGRIEAELSRDRHRELRPQKGERLFIRLKQLRLFLKDHRQTPPAP